METDLVAELRRLLHEVITPELEALLAQVEAAHLEMKLMEQNMVEAIAAVRAEHEAMRAEYTAAYADLCSQLDALRAQVEMDRLGELESDKKPDPFVM